MTTIPDDIAAMMDLLVQNELILVRPVRCATCERYGSCWLHPEGVDNANRKDESR